MLLTGDLSGFNRVDQVGNGLEACRWETIAEYPTQAEGWAHVAAHRRIVMPCEVTQALAEVADEYLALVLARKLAIDAGFNQAARMMMARTSELAPIFWDAGCSTPHV